MKSSMKTISVTGVHCPGSNEEHEPKPDIRVTVEELRCLEDDLDGEVLEKDDEFEELAAEGLICDLINGLIACLAACSTLNFLKF
jgi:hypothetical protein